MKTFEELLSMAQKNREEIRQKDLESMSTEELESYAELLEVAERVLREGRGKKYKSLTSVEMAELALSAKTFEEYFQRLLEPVKEPDPAERERRKQEWREFDINELRKSAWESVDNKQRGL